MIRPSFWAGAYILYVTALKGKPISQLQNVIWFTMTSSNKIVCYTFEQKDLPGIMFGLDYVCRLRVQ